MMGHDRYKWHKQIGVLWIPFYFHACWPAANWICSLTHRDLDHTLSQYIESELTGSEYILLNHSLSIYFTKGTSWGVEGGVSHRVVVKGSVLGSDPSVLGDRMRCSLFKQWPSCKSVTYNYSRKWGFHFSSYPGHCSVHRTRGESMSVPGLLS